MLRTILLGVLTVSAAASCKGSEGGPAVQAGVSAGKVVEISGTVTARRGAESRTLVSGNEISGDDLIETAADSRISIVLAHNNATWSLGPNKKEKVADSMAWSLAKVAQPAKAADEATSAAGRHAEKAGANSGATVDERKADAVPPAAAVQTAPTTAPSPTPGAPPVVQAVAPAPEPAAPKATAKPTRRATNLRAADDAGGGALPLMDSLGQGGLGASGGGPLEKGAAKKDLKVDEPPPPPPPPPPPSPVVIEDSNRAKVVASPSEIQVLATRDRDKLKACLDASTTTLAVVLKIENGKASFALPSGTSPAITSCLAKVAANMKPSASLTAKLAVTIK